jgi:hypothetical protein
MDKQILYFPINKCACTTSFKKLFNECDNIIVPNLNIENNNNLGYTEFQDNVFVHNI